MFLCRRIFGVSSMLMVTSCSVLPMPEDVTSVRTEDIVQHIRCETRDAVYDAVLKYLSAAEHSDESDPTKKLNDDEKAEFKKFDAYVIDSSDNYTKINKIYDDILQTPPNKRTKFDNTLLKYSQASIMFEFNLQMIASSHNSFTSTISHPFTTGLFSFGLTSQDNFDRQNTMIFRVADDFAELVTTQNNKRCSNPAIDNSFYPIVGKIGIAKIIDTSVYLNENENLTKNTDADKNKSVTAEIKFTTITSQQFDPKVGINSRGHFVQVSALELNSAVGRSDTHGVQVAFVVPLKTAFVPQTRAHESGASFQPAQTLPGASPATKKRASDELDNLKATINGTIYQNLVKTLPTQ